MADGMLGALPIKIRYCNEWAYFPMAAWTAAKLFNEFCGALAIRFEPSTGRPL